MARRKAPQEGQPSPKIVVGQIFRDSEGKKVAVLKVDKNSANISVTFRTKQGEEKLPMEEFKKRFKEKLTFVQGQKMVNKKTGEVYTLNTDVLANVTRGNTILIRDVETGLLLEVPQITLGLDYVAVKSTAEVVALAEQATEPRSDIEAEELVQENGSEGVAPEEETLPAEESVEENDAEEIPESDDVESQPEPQPEPTLVTQAGENADSKPASSAGAFVMAGAATVAAAATAGAQSVKATPTITMSPLSQPQSQQEQQPEAKSPEAAPVQDSVVQEAAPAEKKDVAFEQLKALLEEKRQEYVEDNYRHASSVSRLAKILGIVHIEKNTDL
jgi:hypothetical protein